MLHRTGWSCATWPEEYGGRGLSPVEAVVLTEEMACGRHARPTAGGRGDPRRPDHPAVGDDEQKRRFLPPIVRGEEIWCQGFSEPASGSDLASLQTMAVRDGDDWVIDGTKIWTSEAQDADLVFMLVRTDPDVPRHRGISYLLVSMRQPGITVRPIPQIDGTAGFNEVRFEGARCPAGHLLGGEGNGWVVANSTLGFERGTSASTSYRRFSFEVSTSSRRPANGPSPILSCVSAWRGYGPTFRSWHHGYRVVMGSCTPSTRPDWLPFRPSPRSTGRRCTSA